MNSTLLQPRGPLFWELSSFFASDWSGKTFFILNYQLKLKLQQRRPTELGVTNVKHWTDRRRKLNLYTFTRVPWLMNKRCFFSVSELESVFKVIRNFFFLTWWVEKVYEKNTVKNSKFNHDLDLSIENPQEAESKRIPNMQHRHITLILNITWRKMFYVLKHT